jgi:hypothetical protein
VHLFKDEPSDAHPLQFQQCVFSSWHDRNTRFVKFAGFESGESIDRNTALSRETCSSIEISPVFSKYKTWPGIWEKYSSTLLKVCGSIVPKNWPRVISMRIPLSRHFRTLWWQSGGRFGDGRRFSTISTFDKESNAFFKTIA